MNTGPLVTVAVVLGLAFLLASQAKDSEGKKYGIKKMARIWIIALGLMGFGAVLIPISKVEDGEVITVPLTPLILIALPFFTLGSRLLQARRCKRAERVDG